MIASELQYGWPPWILECDRLNVAAAGWGCEPGKSVVFVYDKPTGKLTGAIETAGWAETCLAGSSSIDFFDVRSQNCTLHNCLPNDAGWDTGTCNFDEDGGSRGD